MRGVGEGATRFGVRGANLEVRGREPGSARRALFARAQLAWATGSRESSALVSKARTHRSRDALACRRCANVRATRSFWRRPQWRDHRAAPALSIKDVHRARVNEMRVKSAMHCVDVALSRSPQARTMTAAPKHRTYALGSPREPRSIDYAYGESRHADQAIHTG